MYTIREAKTDSYLWNMNIVERRYEFDSFDPEMPEYNWCLCWETRNGCSEMLDRIIKYSDFNKGDLEVVEL